MNESAEREKILNRDCEPFEKVWSLSVGSLWTLRQQDAIKFEMISLFPKTDIPEIDCLPDLLQQIEFCDPEDYYAAFPYAKFILAKGVADPVKNATAEAFIAALDFDLPFSCAINRIATSYLVVKIRLGGNAFKDLIACFEKVHKICCQ